MGIRSAVALLLLIASVRGQQTIESISGEDTFVCPTQETGTVAYVQYCPQQDTNGGDLLGVSAIMLYANAPASYAAESGGIILICSYPTSSGDYTCQYNGGDGQALQPASNNAAACPAPISTVPQPSPGVNYKRDMLNTFAKRLSTQTPFTCPRSVEQDSTFWLNAEQISIGNRGGSTGTIYDCVWNNASPDATDSYRCSYPSDPTQGPTVAANFGDDPCPNTLCNAVMTGSNNLRRRGFFVEGAANVARNQVKASSLRSRYKAKKNKRAKLVRSSL